MAGLGASPRDCGEEVNPAVSPAAAAAVLAVVFGQYRSTRPEQGERPCVKSHIHRAGDQTRVRFNEEGANSQVQAAFNDSGVELSLDPGGPFAAVALERIDRGARPFPDIRAGRLRIALQEFGIDVA